MGNKLPVEELNNGANEMAPVETAPEGEEAVFEEVLEAIPPEHRKMVAKMMFSSVQMANISPESKAMEKITEDHITKFLDTAAIDMQNSYKEKGQRKIFNFLVLLVSMVFVIAVIVLLKEMPEIMEKVIYTIGGVIAGAFGGYGIGKHRGDDD